MAKRFRKLISYMLVYLAIFVSVSCIIRVNAEVLYTGQSEILYELNPTSNFFTQVEDKTPITISDEHDKLSNDGYVLGCYNNELEVYYKSATCGIAVYDIVNGYTWYSSYQNDPEYTFTALVQARNESGIVIEYYNVDSKGAIKSAEVCCSAKSNKKVSGKATMTKVENGFDLAVVFESYGISFTVEIRIDGSKLSINVPYTSIKEETVGKLNPKDYKLKSISLFSYLGAENYLINGYSFIPDGSGALIRYNDTASSTGYVKKLYGEDYSFTEYPSSYHIKENGYLGLPIYGVNHGYNQAAFLCEVTNGYGVAELNSYPYMFNNIPINTTFFKFYTRDTFNVALSSGTMNLLNDDPYPTDYTVTYSFLRNNDANYVGMANKYRESLALEENDATNEDIALHLEVLGLDYKPGLFGKNYIKMTNFAEALEIVQDLEDSNVKNFALTYLGWNKGGYFNKGATNAKAAPKLGGKSKLKKLTNYLDENNYSIDYTINPYVSDTFGFGSKNIKKIGLSSFEVTQKSSMEQIGYYVLPTELAKTITSKSNKYEKLGIDSFKIDNLNVAYSYRYSSNATYRTEMINQVVDEVKKISDYKISMEKPNSYLLKYLENYYEAYYESNKYIYETDSVPFMSILLSGYVNQFMPNINYVSDYDLAVLRMIEYNIYPSFIITKEEAYDLRYTNYEYLNSTQYALWKDLMVSMYTKTNNALKYVIGAKLIDHEYVLAGVAKCTYSNGIVVYVNYNNSTLAVDGVNLSPYSVAIKGGN